jgi:hypothetical protein
MMLVLAKKFFCKWLLGSNTTAIKNTNPKADNRLFLANVVVSDIEGEFGFNREVECSDGKSLSSSAWKDVVYYIC